MLDGSNRKLSMTGIHAAGTSPTSESSVPAERGCSMRAIGASPSRIEIVANIEGLE
jgi:hypothetical protein